MCFHDTTRISTTGYDRIVRFLEITHGFQSSLFLGKYPLNKLVFKIGKRPILNTKAHSDQTPSEVNGRCVTITTRKIVNGHKDSSRDHGRVKEGEGVSGNA